MSWCTIESDPGVFTELIEQIGVKGVQVEELVDMENSTFAALKPVYGLIFLFKWQKEKPDDKRVVLEGGVPGVFFAQQVINNACATQAIISVLMNRSEIDLGTEMKQFKGFTADLPPDVRGWAIGNSDLIRTAHNSFNRPEPFALKEKKATDDDDEAFHFIGYVPVNGVLYELDGLQNGPIMLGECTMENWLEHARPAIQERILKYSQKEIRFNLLALVANRKEAAEKKLAAINKRRSAIESKLSGGAAMDTSSDDTKVTGTPAELKAESEKLAAEAKVEQHVLEMEAAKRAEWKAENVRRKHNYIPFVYNFLKALAERGQLQGMIESSQKLNQERIAKAKAARDKEKEKAAAAPKKP